MPLPEKSICDMYGRDLEIGQLVWVPALDITGTLLSVQRRTHNNLCKIMIRRGPEGAKADVHGHVLKTRAEHVVFAPMLHPTLTPDPDYMERIQLIHDQRGHSRSRVVSETLISAERISATTSKNIRWITLYG